MTEYLHVASLVVHTQPSTFESVRVWLESQPEMEIHARSPAGKLVVVIESQHEKELLEITDRIRDQAGVLGAALIYHEQVEAPDQPIEPAQNSNTTRKIPVKGVTS